MNLVRMLAAVAAALSIGAGASFSAEHHKALKGSPLEARQGEIVELKAPGAGFSSVEGRLGNERIYFFPRYDGAHGALVGIDLEAKPGLAHIIAKASDASGREREMKIPLRIKAKMFKSESFSVAPEFDQLGPETLERIRSEQETMARAFAQSGLPRLWEGVFLPPVAPEMTSPFGYRRVINGAARAPHTGVDLKAAMGTEVIAANRGRVVLLGDFFYSGKSVVLDHGAGLFTLYFHLSEFKVQEGTKIERGEVIGLSGMSGRVTGPHLHWGARINGARIDPFELVEKLSGVSGQTAGANAKMERVVK